MNVYKWRETDFKPIYFSAGSGTLISYLPKPIIELTYIFGFPFIAFSMLMEYIWKQNVEQ
jgi:hypothetical protein